MTYPTELTLTTGTTVYAGDPESDERIKGREVRVSVTYRIDDEKADVPLLAGVKAAELERVHRAVCECLRAPSESAGEKLDEEATDPAGLEAYDPGPQPPDDPLPEGEDYTGRTNGHGNGGHPGYRSDPQAPAAPGGGALEAETDWATKPQVLALGSHFKRLGLSPQNQTALLRDHFGKFRLERLTKGEAASLMRSLERGELEPKRSELEQREWEPAEAARSH